MHLVNCSTTKMRCMHSFKSHTLFNCNTSDVLSASMAQLAPNVSKSRGAKLARLDKCAVASLCGHLHAFRQAYFCNRKGITAVLLHSLLYVHIIHVLQGNQSMCEEYLSLAGRQTGVAGLHASACSLHARPSAVKHPYADA